jgi:hypothetical protein
VRAHAVALKQGSDSVGVTKQIVYRYNGDEHSDETVFDRDGDMQIPVHHEVLQRHGKGWKVFAVQRVETVAIAIPVYRVFLTENF